MSMYDLTGIVNQANAVVEKGKKNAVAAGINPVAVNTDTATDPWLNDYTVYTDKTGNTYVSSKGSQNEQFIVPPSAKGEKATVTEDINTARSALEAQAGGRAKLESALKAAGYNGDYYANIDNAIRRYSVDTLAAYQDSKGTGVFGDYKAFIKGLASSGGGGSKTRVDQTFTDRAGTDRDINSTMVDLIGRPATKEEKDAYFTALRKAEKSAKTVTTSVADGSGGYKTVVASGNTLSAEDRALIAANIARKTLAGTDVDTFLNSASGSSAATDIAKLQEYASNYGVELSAADALKYVAAGLGQKDYINKQEERIRQTAMVLHPQLKDHFSAGGTYKDIADQYAYRKTKKLGIAVPKSTSDSDINDAIAKGMSLSDFDMAMQAKPEWRKSEEAHKTVNDFINNIAQTWGLG